MTKQKTIFVAVLSAAIVLTMLFCIMWHQYRRGANTMPDRKKYVITDEPPPLLLRPSCAPIDEDQRVEIKAIFDSVVMAYSNLQYDAIQEARTSLLEKVEHLTDKDYRHAERAFSGMLYDEIVSSRAPLRSFSSVEEFVRRVRADFAAIWLYGAIIKRRKDYNQLFHSIEAKELKRLRGYRKVFVDEGNAECAEATAEAIETWTAHIESQQGFTRAMTLYYLERGRIWVPSPSDQCPPNWEKICQRAVRQGAEPLVNVGYNPKWIDELMKTPEPEAYYVPLCY